MTTTMQAFRKKSILNPISRLDLDKTTLDRMLSASVTSALLPDMSVAFAMREFMFFAKDLMTEEEAGYLACEFGFGAQATDQDLTRLCAGQDAGYQGDYFVCSFFRGQSKQEHTGQVRTVSYNLLYKRLIDDHRGHSFRLCGIIENVLHLAPVNGIKMDARQELVKFEMDTVGKWTTSKGATRQVRDHLLRRDA